MRLRYLGGIAAAGLTACAVVLLYISQVKAPVDSQSLYISSVTPPAESGPCITASDGRPMGSAYLDMDASLGAIAREIPAFAGLWRGAQLTVAVTDLDVDRVQLADAIARQFGPHIFDPAGFKLVKAEYSFTQLAAWYDCMRDPVWSTGGVITTDVDEQRNRIRIEATSAETRRAMEQAVAALGIPARAVLIEVRQPVLGPGPGPDEQVLAHRLLASEKRLPSRHFMRGEDVIMKLADDQQRYEELWRLFGMTGETLGQTKVPPAIDWAKESVLFVGLGESGSCPMRLTAVSLEPAGRLVVYISEGDGRYVCTGDYTPRTFVVALPRTGLPDGLIRATVRRRHREPELLLREDDPSISGRVEWSWEGKGSVGSGSIVRYLQVVALPDRVMVTIRTEGQPVHLQNTEVQYRPDGVEARFPAHLGGEPAIAVALDHPLLRGVRMEEHPGGHVVLKIETHTALKEGRWYEDGSLIGTVLMKYGLP